MCQAPSFKWKAVNAGLYWPPLTSRPGKESAVSLQDQPSFFHQQPQPPRVDVGHALPTGWGSMPILAKHPDSIMGAPGINRQRPNCRCPAAAQLASRLPSCAQRCPPQCDSGEALASARWVLRVWSSSRWSARELLRAVNDAGDAHRGGGAGSRWLSALDDDSDRDGKAEANAGAAALLKEYAAGFRRRQCPPEYSSLMSQ